MPLYGSARPVRNCAGYDCFWCQEEHDRVAKVLRCRAAVAREPGKPLTIEDVEVEPPLLFEVRIQVLYTTLCPLDFQFWEGKGKNPVFPRIFGHEAVGIVEMVGDCVGNLDVGDHVIAALGGECGDCRQCNSGETNLCNWFKVDTVSGVMSHDNNARFFNRDGEHLCHFMGLSTFCEYIVLPSDCVVRVNPEAPLDKLCLLTCGIITGLGASLNVAKPKEGQSVAIFGLGDVGLAAAEGARLLGASRIIGVDSNPQRFDVAKKFGVTDFVNPKDHENPVHEVICGMVESGVDRGGVARSIECTGEVDSMISAFECIDEGYGVAVLAGIPFKMDEAFKTLPMNLLKGRTLKGTFLGDYKCVGDLPSLMEKCVSKELDLDKFVIEKIPFSEINKAFDLMKQGESRRCIIYMDPDRTDDEDVDVKDDDDADGTEDQDANVTEDKCADAREDQATEAKEDKTVEAKEDKGVTE